MQRFKLMSLTLLAVFALAAIGAATASAEPLILVLPGEKVSELKYKGEGGKGTLEDSTKKTIVGTKVKAEATFNALTESDALTGTTTLDFEGTKKEKVACRSENAKGEKDPVETILVVTTITAASETSTTGVLEPMLVNTVNGTLFINCGGVKEEVKGSLPCLVDNGLEETAAGGVIVILCHQAGGKQTTGTCLETKATCEKLEKEPFLANLGGGFQSAGEEVEVSGTFNKMITIDD